MTVYAKGEKPRDLDAAKGGLVLERHKNFVKEENDDYHPLGTGLLGPENTQSYTKKGKDPKAKREGDSKSKAPIKPRS